MIPTPNNSHKNYFFNILNRELVTSITLNKRYILLLFHKNN
jgi:hypothetical protein